MIPARYTVAHSLDAWHVYDTRVHAPVAFTTTAHEHVARTLASRFNDAYTCALALTPACPVLDTCLSVDPRNPAMCICSDNKQELPL